MQLNILPITLGEKLSFAPPNISPQNLMLLVNDIGFYKNLFYYINPAAPFDDDTMIAGWSPDIMNVKTLYKTQKQFCATRACGIGDSSRIDLIDSDQYWYALFPFLGCCNIPESLSDIQKKMPELWNARVFMYQEEYGVDKSHVRSERYYRNKAFRLKSNLDFLRRYPSFSTQEHFWNQKGVAQCQAILFAFHYGLQNEGYTKLIYHVASYEAGPLHLAKQTNEKLGLALEIEIKEY